MAIQKELRLGFIGMGPRGAGLAKTCKTVSGLKVTALCDKYTDLVERAAQNLDDPEVKLYTDHAKMLKEAPIDAVFVVVEPENCPQLVLDSLESGKHVLSEVPMSFTMEDLWRIVVTVERTGLKYMMGEQVRYMPFMQKWKELLEDGTLGKIVYAEGQYLHGVTGDRFYMDPVTGRRLTLEEAKLHPNPKRSRFWNLTHPILYLPHELSPLLRVLNDRVVSVVCMGTRPQSYVHDFLPRPDFETALMHTANDTLLRLSCCFTIFQIEKKMTGRHWYNLIGTKGSVETHRSNHDQMKLLITGEGNEYPEEVWWDWDSLKVPPEALASGHGGSDYWPLRYFVDAVLNDTRPEMDVYAAAETAAPAILAAQSAEKDGVRLEVPDFRPGPHRREGEHPIQGSLGLVQKQLRVVTM